MNTRNLYHWLLGLSAACIVAFGFLLVLLQQRVKALESVQQSVQLAEPTRNARLGLHSTQSYRTIDGRRWTVTRQFLTKKERGEGDTFNDALDQAIRNANKEIRPPDMPIDWTLKTVKGTTGGFSVPRITVELEATFLSNCFTDPTNTAETPRKP